MFTIEQKKEFVLSAKFRAKFEKMRAELIEKLCFKLVLIFNILYITINNTRIGLLTSPYCLLVYYFLFVDEDFLLELLLLLSFI